MRKIADILWTYLWLFFVKIIMIAFDAIASTSNMPYLIWNEKSFQIFIQELDPSFMQR